MEPRVILLNPQCTTVSKARLPLSLISLASVLKYPWTLVDGNFEPGFEPVKKLLKSGYNVLAVSVMPGAQIKTAIEISAAARKYRPEAKVVWGGYFPSMFPEAVNKSPLVDYTIAGRGERVLPILLESFADGKSVDESKGLIVDKKIVKDRNSGQPRLQFRFEDIDVDRYVMHTHLGTRTLSLITSMGCPHLCTFCAVINLYGSRWLPERPEMVIAQAKYFVDNYNINALEFFDSNFFVSEKRTNIIASGLEKFDLSWWGLGRVDTLLDYKDASWELLRNSGCKMIFFGAETPSEQSLGRIKKELRPEQTLELVSRCKSYGIVPELSFCLGSPGYSGTEVDLSINFIKEVKKINPLTEIIIYFYTPVPAENFGNTKASLQITYPSDLEAFTGERWQAYFSLKDPRTPWLAEKDVQKIRDFEMVLKFYYPTGTDIRLKRFTRAVLKAMASIRWKTGTYSNAFILKRLWNRFSERQPEIF